MDNALIHMTELPPLLDRARTRALQKLGMRQRVMDEGDEQEALGLPNRDMPPAQVQPIPEMRTFAIPMEDGTEDSWVYQVDEKELNPAGIDRFVEKTRGEDEDYLYSDGGLEVPLVEERQLYDQMRQKLRQKLMEMME